MSVLPRPIPGASRLVALLLLLALMPPSPPARAETLADLTFSMLKEVERLRGLEPTRTVGIGQRSPEDLRALLRQRIVEEYTAEQLAGFQRLLALTGLIPTDYDLIGRYVALMAARALGYYDFHTKTLFLSTTTEPPLRASVVLHELTHALQDQHFFIHRRLKALNENEDARTALGALIEGEATALMLEHLLKMEPSGHRFYTVATDELVSYLAEGGEAFMDEPPVMLDLIYFPYRAGLPFIKAVRRRRP
ncbi:MAG: DUF6782 family putative metallopeptidase, partial [Nitrospinota bacterium]